MVCDICLSRRGSAPIAQLRLDGIGAASDYPTVPIGGSARVLSVTFLITERDAV
jgi:hypothetical protein